MHEDSEAKKKPPSRAAITGFLRDAAARLPA
jgi:hypothetical protein